MSRVFAIAIALLLVLHTAWATARPIHTCCEDASCPDIAMCLGTGCHPGDSQAVLLDGGVRPVHVPGVLLAWGSQLQGAGLEGSEVWRPPPTRHAL